MIHIDHRFTSLNKYTNANRGNKFGGAKIKKDETDIVYWHARGVKIPTPAKITFIWYYAKTRGKLIDPDNICFAKKQILDGLVKAGALPDDTHEYIKGFEDKFILSDTWGVDIIW
jgi:hypothetical protein